MNLNTQSNVKTPFRLIISGNSGQVNTQQFLRELELYLQRFNVQRPIHILTGMLTATDRWASELAATRRWQCFKMTPFLASSTLDLYKRNERMVKLGDGLLLFLDKPDSLHKHLLDAAHFQQLHIRSISTKAERLDSALHA